MSAAEEPGVVDAQLDDLRQRLYRADATDEDLRRYLDERAAVLPPAEAATGPSTLEWRRWPRRPVAIGAVAVVLAVCAAATAVLVHQPAPGLRTDAAAQDVHVVAMDGGDGRLLEVDPGRLSGPTPTALMVEGASTAAQRFEGVGDQLVPVSLPSAAFGTQRAVVVISSAGTSTIAWRALRLGTRRDWSSFEQVLARGRVTGLADLDSPTTFGYAGAPPSRISVEAPAGLHWTLVVAADDGPTDGLR